MDQMQTSTGQVLPHIVQLIRTSVNSEVSSVPPKVQSPQIIHISHPTLQTSQGNVTYHHQTITTDTLNIPSMSNVDRELQTRSSQNIVMSSQSHLQTLQSLSTPMQSQVMQNGDMGQSLQITSHLILPPVFKQHMLVNDVQQPYYNQVQQSYQKDGCANIKMETELSFIGEKQIECKSENTMHASFGMPSETKKRSRSHMPNPSKWACNVRKMKHQSGEAYISRRGKYVPERRVRNTKDCLKSCKYKCSERINDTDREHIFKAFYSLNSNEKKHFLLNTTERNNIKHAQAKRVRPRNYSFIYFFVVRAVRHVVCKNFYLGTLAISQKPVYNVHLGKTDTNIPKRDGRGLSEASDHSLSSEIKDRVRKHVMSFNTDKSKPIKHFSQKKQFLQPNLTVKQMYRMYYSDCGKDGVTAVKESMYREIVKKEFNLHFRKVKFENQLCCKCKGSVNQK